VEEELAVENAKGLFGAPVPQLLQIHVVLDDKGVPGTRPSFTGHARRKKHPYPIQ